jgi:hypothetical protein
MKQEMNCRELKGCGRGKNGKNTGSPGVCPASLETRVNGTYRLARRFDSRSDPIDRRQLFRPLRNAVFSVGDRIVQYFF